MAAIWQRWLLTICCVGVAAICAHGEPGCPAGLKPGAAPAPENAGASNLDGELVLAVALSPDGQQLASAGIGRTIRLWSVATGKEIRQLEHPRGVTALAFSPQGQQLATAGGDRTVRVWDLATGKEQYRFKVDQGAFCVAFSSDGAMLAAGRTTIDLWDLATGKPLRELRGHAEPIFGLVFSPDSKMLASAGADQMIRLWNPATGAAGRYWEQTNTATALAYAPDSKTLAAGSGDGTVRLWDAATGKEGKKFSGQRGQPVWSLAFSADGTTLAVGTGGNDPAIRRWSVSTGQALTPLKGFRGGFLPVAFTSESRSLTATGVDPLSKLWDVADPKKERSPAQTNLAADELQALWDYLAGDDAPLALEAVETLALDPRRTIDYCKGRLHPEPPSPPLPQLIAQLDSDRFDERQKATATLERLGKGAEKALREHLKTRPSLEVTRRIEQILDHIESGIVPPEQRRTLHTIELLRRYGTPEARQLLQHLAGGAADSWVTQEAKAALAKMR
jgi:hypothetical protein